VKLLGRKGVRRKQAGDLLRKAEERGLKLPRTGGTACRRKRRIKEGNG